MVLDNQKSFRITFKPLENKSYGSNQITFSDFSYIPPAAATGSFLYVSGEGFLDTFDYYSTGYERWDLISWLFYKDSNFILKLWQSNKHLSDSDKKQVAPTPGTPLFLESLTEEEKTETEEENAAILPPWRQ